ncbi:prostaglandin E2 receptor EP4 subtype-like [Saccostrea echinata]|uniref:prostaglandin E2 receptor EP4 subtype-like n=1 Tax=Saccostrea echinata TaxID=191078 RepID=UPI002A830A98|nr:prostaglandin E2 receptor EP4 subtype-like [Saccostrea echinata]
MNSQMANSTHDPDIHESGIPTYVFFAFGFVGNGLALCVICCNREHHQWRSFYIFFLGLAMSDFLNQLIVFPFEVLRYGSNFNYTIPPHLCKAESFIYSFTQISSGMIISGISTDRYLVLTNSGQPLDAMRWNRRKYLFGLLMIWIFSALVSLLHLFVGQSETFYPGSWCFIDVTNKGIGSVFSATVYSLTGICVLVYTVYINICVMCMSCRDPEHRGRLLDTDRVTGFYDVHVNFFLAISVTLYVLCWGPFLVDIFLRGIKIISGSPGKLELWLVRLIDLKSNVNPWLYVLLRKEYIRKIFLRFQTCREGNIQRQPPDGESNRLLQESQITFSNPTSQ